MAGKSVKVRIDGDARGLQKATRDSEGALNRLNRAGGRVGQSLKVGLAVGAGGAVAAAGVIKSATKEVETLAKGTAMLSRTTGLETKEASAWVSTAKARGVEAGKLNMGFIALARNMKAANDGGKSQAKTFRELSVSQRALKDNDVSGVINDVADGFEKMADGPEKAALAQKLFGKQSQTLLPLLNAGSEGLKKNLDMAEKYGLTLDKKGVKSALAYAGAQRELNMAWSGLKIVLGTQVMPVVSKAFVATAEFVSNMRSGTGTAGEFGRSLSSTFNDIRAVVVPAVDAVKKGFESLPSAGKTAAIAATALGAIFLATGPVGAGIAALVAGVVLIRRNWDTIGPIFERVKVAVTGALNVVKANVTGFVQRNKADLAQFVQAVRNVGTILVGVFKGVVVPAFEFLLAVAKRALPGIVTTVRGAFQVIGGIVKVFAGVLTLDFGKAWDGVKQIFSGALKVITGALRTATAPIREVASRIGDGISDTIGAAFGALRKVVAGAVSFLLRRLDDVLGGLSSVYSAAGKIPGIGGAFKRAANGIDTAREKLRQTADAIDGVKSKGSNVKVNIRFSSLGLDTIQDGLSDLLAGARQAARRSGRKGGKFRGGGLVPIAVSPGELLRFPNGSEGIVPGRRVAADNFRTAVPAGTEVYTDHGQSLLAQGLSRARALRQQLPHFASGGKVNNYLTGYESGVAGRSRSGVLATVLDGLKGNTDKAKKASKKSTGSSSEAGGFAKYGLTTKNANGARKMLSRATSIAGKGYAYAYGGGHNGSFAPSSDIRGTGAFGYDCSGYVSAILNAGGLLGSPMAVSSNSGLGVIGKAGSGKWLTIGVRGSSGLGAHTMVRLGNRYFESGGGSGAGERRGWNGSFQMRHIPGFRLGGKVKSAIANLSTATKKNVTGRVRALQAALTGKGVSEADVRAASAAINSTLTRIRKGGISHREKSPLRGLKAGLALTQGESGRRVGKRVAGAESLRGKLEADEELFALQQSASTLSVENGVYKVTTPDEISSLKATAAQQQGTVTALASKEKSLKNAVAAAKKTKNKSLIAKAQAALAEHQKAMLQAQANLASTLTAYEDAQAAAIENAAQLKEQAEQAAKEAKEAAKAKENSALNAMQALASLTETTDDDKNVLTAFEALYRRRLDQAIADGDNDAIAENANALKQTVDALKALDESIKNDTGAREAEAASRQQLIDLTAEQVKNQKTLMALAQQQGGQLLSAVIAAVNGDIGGRVGLGTMTPSFATGVASY